MNKDSILVIRLFANDKKKLYDYANNIDISASLIVRQLIKQFLIHPYPIGINPKLLNERKNAQNNTT